MPSDSFRFLHSGDFHLGTPLQGLYQLPEGWRDALVDARYAAAGRVFETAILEEVAFVALSGNLLDPETAGPRALAFMVQQFELLNEHSIQVYWTGGPLDRPDRWPEGIDLPANVRMFSSDHVEEVVHERGQRPLATIAGVSWSGHPRIRASEFSGSSDHLPTVVIAHGKADAQSLDALHIDYWALGGQHRAECLFSSPGTAQYAGSPQGGSPTETGPHSCTLVNIEGGSRLRTKQVPTESVRWCQERLKVSTGATVDELRRQLSERMQHLVTESTGQPLLVCWTIEDKGRLGAKLRQEGLAEELTAWLRERFGKSEPGAWTVSLEAPPPDTIPEELQGEETILGDFLRAVEQHQQETNLPLPVETLIAEPYRASLIGTLAIGDLAQRRQILERACQLGLDVLSGEDATAWLGE